MNTKKTTIIALAALALGIATAQAGRGCQIIVPCAPSQLQHANAAKHHFAVGEMYSYTVNSVSFCLKTMDASSPGNRIVLYNNGQYLCELAIPLERKVVAEGVLNKDTCHGVFPIELTGDVNLTFDFEHAASAFGAVALNCEYAPTPPEASGNLEAPLAANAEDHPSIDWNALISVKTETTVTDVSGAVAGATVEADNAGQTKTKKSK